MAKMSVGRPFRITVLALLLVVTTASWMDIQASQRRQREQQRQEDILLEEYRNYESTPAMPVPCPPGGPHGVGHRPPCFLS